MFRDICYIIDTLYVASQNFPHARCVIMIEACEESGSKDLPHYIDLLSTQIGQPSLVVCLDSGCANYEQLWLTNSLRGKGVEYVIDIDHHKIPYHHIMSTLCHIIAYFISYHMYHAHANTT